MGRKEHIPLHAPRQLAFLIRSMVSQRLLAEKKVTGIMHLMVFYGFLVLALGTVLLLLDHHLGLQLLTGSRFVLFKIVLNTLGLAALIGISGLLVRRYILKTGRGFQHDRHPGNPASSRIDPVDRLYRPRAVG